MVRRRLKASPAAKWQCQFELMLECVRLKPVGAFMYIVYIVQIDIITIMHMAAKDNKTAQIKNEHANRNTFKSSLKCD